MKISWFGQSCFKIEGQSGAIITDPYGPMLGRLRLPEGLEADIVTVSHDHGDHNNVEAVKGKPKVIKSVGSFVIDEVKITGVATFHDAQGGERRGDSIAFIIEVDGFRVVHLGDLGHMLTSGQLAAIGKVDIVLVPVGGIFTIDAKGAAEVVRQLKPIIVIPMHYKLENMDIPFPLAGVDAFVATAGLPTEERSALEVAKGTLGAGPRIVVLTPRR